MTTEHINFRCPAPKASVEANPKAWWEHVREVAGHFGLTNSQLAKAASKRKPRTPTAWVEAAMAVTCTCPKCHGTGTYETKTFSGDCFACGGKGVCDHADRKRNLDYWDYNSHVEARIIADQGAEGLVLRHPTV